MIVIKLREAIADFQDRRGQKLTYDELAERTGLSRTTIESIASRADYNPTLATVDKLCRALECRVEDLLEYIPETSQTRSGSHQ